MQLRPGEYRSEWYEILLYKRKQRKNVRTLNSGHGDLSFLRANSCPPFLRNGPHTSAGINRKGRIPLFRRTWSLVEPATVISVHITRDLLNY